LAVLLGVFRVFGAVFLLVAWIPFPPFSLAVSASLSVIRIRLQFAAVIFPFASLLASFPTANALSGVIKGGEEEVLAKGTLSAGRLHASSI
jgi:hypothetical protein